jgi:hypothetical protein
MKIKTNVGPGRIAFNHNQTTSGLKVRIQVKVGRISFNHNQSLAR